MEHEVLIVSNGPGELAAWVRPVVRRLRAELPEVRVVVALVPCPYASGQEAAAVAAWPERPGVWTPRQTVRHLLGAKRPDGLAPAGRGAVLFLGGDQVFAALLGVRTGWPVLVHTDGPGRWPALVSRYLAAGPAVERSLRARSIAAERVRLVGNLMVDALAGEGAPAPPGRAALGLRADAPVLALLPGSKPFKVRWITPLFLRVAELLQGRRPDLQVVLQRSPFTPRAELVDAVEHPTRRAVTGGSSGRVEQVDGVDWIVTPAGGRVRVLPPDPAGGPVALAAADVALTVPGTNTAELAVLGVPMVVALPLHKPEEIPLDGLVGRLGGMPLLGPPLMRMLARRFLARRPLVALPNLRAGRMITPELLGVFPPEELAEAAGSLLDDPIARRDIRLALLEAMGPVGAAAAVTAEVRAALGIAHAAALAADR